MAKHINGFKPKFCEQRQKKLVQVWTLISYVLLSWLLCVPKNQRFVS